MCWRWQNLLRQPCCCCGMKRAEGEQRGMDLRLRPAAHRVQREESVVVRVQAIKPSARSDHEVAWEGWVRREKGPGAVAGEEGWQTGGFVSATRRFFGRGG